MKKVVYFKAAWCQPCKIVSKDLTSLTVPVDTVDIDENPKAAQSLGIRSVPTLVLFENEHPIGQFGGADAVKQLRRRLEG